MRFNLIDCWLVSTEIVDTDTIKSSTKDIQIIKKSILKNAYRAFVVDTRRTIEESDWYKNFLLGNEVRFYIDGSGVYKIVNIDLSDNELYFERINLPIGYKPWIFYSWQSDYNSSRSNIKDALDDAIKFINENHNPKQPLEIVESVRGEDGADNIADAIKRNIDLSLMFIADITNVAQVKKAESDTEEPKGYPNANVVFEMSYSFCRKKSSQIVLVKKKRADFPNDSVPFDFSHNRHEIFEQPSKLKDKLKQIITAHLKRINFIS